MLMGNGKMRVSNWSKTEFPFWRNKTVFSYFIKRSTGKEEKQ